MALLSFLLSTLIFLSHPFATIFSLGAIPLLPSQAVTEITQSTPDLRWVISQVSPAVVRVRSGFKVLRGELLYDTGTGFFISQEYILTNNHVVGDDKYVLVTVYDINFRSIDLKGEVIFKDQIGDLALVQVPQQKDQTYLHLSDSLPYAGTPVVALGFAFNSWTASTGHITGGTFSENITNRSKGFIEKTDAAINPGRLYSRICG